MATLAGATFFALDDFLLSDEMSLLWHYVLAEQGRFAATQVKGNRRAKSFVNTTFRRSRVLMDLGPHREFVAQRLRSYVSAVARNLSVQPFRTSRIEIQLTATNDGGFFRAHRDNGAHPFETRLISFVLYFHRQPKPFSGGELILYKPGAHSHDPTGEGSITIVPKHNRIVFFPSYLLHEVCIVSCFSREFRDSRFTLNGWFHCERGEL
ncbi:MAG: 2OG-Fe(II) oxygenase [Acidobacteriaceae bacterium]|nr:2OG-Fe(II) oxygenase [Acidobacteriaceae bacterium]